MTAADKQIVTMYEDLDISPEQIVQELNEEYDIEAIKMSLLQNSPKYKQDAHHAVAITNGNAPDAQGIFTEDERQLARQTAVRLMQHSELDVVQARMVETILNEQRAERTSQKLTALAGAKINILQFQEHLTMVKASMQRAREASVVVDVTPKPEAEAMKQLEEQTA